MVSHWEKRIPTTSRGAPRPPGWPDPKDGPSDGRGCGAVERRPGPVETGHAAATLGGSSAAPQNGKYSYCNSSVSLSGLLPSKLRTYVHVKKHTRVLTAP